MHRKRKRITRRRSKGQRKNRKRRLHMILYIVAAVMIVFAAFFVRNIYFYITGNDVTEDNRYPVKGVDVSSYQLDIDWEGLEEEGFKFAFIKATEGSSHVDERFEYNWEEVNKTDIRAGAYHFLSYDTGGRKQAENFINTVDKKWGMLPPVVDVELYGDYVDAPPDKNTLYGILDTVLEEFEKEYGMRPIIYTNTHIYDEYISERYEDYDIWISAHDIPEKLEDGRKWTFCQYTFYGTSDNVAKGEKYVDMNVFYGSSWELRNYDGD